MTNNFFSLRIVATVVACLAAVVIVSSCSKDEVIDPPTFSGKALNEFSVELSVGAVKGAKIRDDLVIFMSTSENGTFAERWSVLQEVRTIVIDELETETDYWFKIAIRNKAGMGPMSSAIKITTTEMTIPVTPGFTVTLPTAGDSNHKRFAWETVPNADYYHIYWSNNQAGPFTTRMDVGGYMGENLVGGFVNVNTTANHFRITAVNAKGESPQSATVSVQ
jgi:hypothetical protein